MYLNYEKKEKKSLKPKNYYYSQNYDGCRIIIFYRIKKLYYLN